MPGKMFFTRKSSRSAASESRRQRSLSPPPRRHNSTPHSTAFPRFVPHHHTAEEPIYTDSPSDYSGSSGGSAGSGPTRVHGVRNFRGHSVKVSQNNGEWSWAQADNNNSLPHAPQVQKSFSDNPRHHRGFGTERVRFYPASANPNPPPEAQRHSFHATSSAPNFQQHQFQDAGLAMPQPGGYRSDPRFQHEDPVRVARPAERQSIFVRDEPAPPLARPKRDSAKFNTINSFPRHSASAQAAFGHSSQRESPPRETRMQTDSDSRPPSADPPPPRQEQAPPKVPYWYSFNPRHFSFAAQPPATFANPRVDPRVNPRVHSTSTHTYPVHTVIVRDFTALQQMKNQMESTVTITELSDSGSTLDAHEISEDEVF